MQDERRRYFRIDETIGITYHVIDTEDEQSLKAQEIPDVLDLVSKQDQQIEKLLIEVEEDNPKVAELITVFNQKLERIVNQLVLESHLVGRIAHRVKEANISACGLAFKNDQQVTEGARLRLEITLFPSEKKIVTGGILVGCDGIEDDRWYWRIDFYDMSERSQEMLIQHIVQSQSQQIKKLRGN